MTPLSDGCNFDITVRCDDGRSRVYRTLNSISDSGAKDLHSRGTRVWKAVLFEGGEERGEPVALKDVWVQSGVEPEGTTLQAILDAKRTLEAHDYIDDAFPTVQCHGYVFLDEDRKALDSTLPSLKEPVTQTPVEMEHTTRRSSKQKVHYRVVFTEVCRPLHHERSLSTIFEALARIAKGTFINHMAQISISVSLTVTFM